MKNKKQSWGGKREGAGRKKEVVRLPSPYVQPETANKILALKEETGKTFGQLLDEKFGVSDETVRRP